MIAPESAFQSPRPPTRGWGRVLRTQFLAHPGSPGVLDDLSRLGARVRRSTFQLCNQSWFVRSPLAFAALRRAERSATLWRFTKIS